MRCPVGSGTGVTWVKDPTPGNPAAFTLAGAKGSQTLTLAGQPITLAAGATPQRPHHAPRPRPASARPTTTRPRVASTNDGGNSAPASIVCSSAALTVTKTADASQRQRGRARSASRSPSTTAAPAARPGVTLTDALPGRLGHGRHLGQGPRRRQPGRLHAGRRPGQPDADAGGPADHARRRAPRSRVHITAQTSASECSTYNNTATVASTNDGGNSRARLDRLSAAPTLERHQDRRRRQRQRRRPDRLHAHDQQHRRRATPPASSLTDSLPGGNAATPVHLGDRRHDTATRPASASAAAHGSQVLSLAGQPITLAPGQSLVGPRHGGHQLDQLRQRTTTRASRRQHQRRQPDRGPDRRSPSTAATSPSPRPPTPRASAPAARSATSSPSPTPAPARSPGVSRQRHACRRTPPGLAWSIDAAGSSPGWTIAGGVLGFGPASLAAGASVHVHITSPTTARQLRHGQQHAPRPSSTNDGSPAVGPIAIVVNCPDLGLTKTADAASASAGDPIGYTLTISNTGARATPPASSSPTACPAATPPRPSPGSSTARQATPASFSLSGRPPAARCSASRASRSRSPRARASSVHVTAATTSTSCATYNNSASLVSTNDGSPTAGPIDDHRQLRRPRHHQDRRRPERQRRQPDRLRRHRHQQRRRRGHRASPSATRLPTNAARPRLEHRRRPARSPGLDDRRRRARLRPGVPRGGCLGPRPHHQPDDSAPPAARSATRATADSTNDGSPVGRPDRHRRQLPRRSGSPRPPTPPAPAPATRSATRSRSATPAPGQRHRRRARRQPARRQRRHARHTG